MITENDAERVKKQDSPVSKKLLVKMLEQSSHPAIMA